MFPAIFGAISAIGGLANNISQGSKASRINKLIQEQMDREVESYNLVKSMRELEERESLFQFENERQQARMNRRTQIQQTLLQQQLNQVGKAQQDLQQLESVFNLNQNKEVNKQANSQLMTQAATESQNILQQEEKVQQELQQQQQQLSLQSGVTNQTGSATAMAKQASGVYNSLGLKANTTQAVNQTLETTQQDVATNQKLLELQDALGRTSVTAQGTINNLNAQTSSEMSKLAVQSTREQHRAYMLAAKAAREKQLFRLEKQQQSDLLQHQSNLAQLSNSKVSSPSLLSTALSFGTEAAGVYASIQAMNNKWTPPTPESSPLTPLPQYTSNNLIPYMKTPLQPFSGGVQYTPNAPVSTGVFRL